MNRREMREPLRSLDHTEITVNDPVLLQRLQQIGDFYLSIPTEDTFYEMRRKAGLDTCGGHSLINGKSWFQEGGIVLGQWLQAFCRFYRFTGDHRFRDRAETYVNALSQVQSVVPSCYICETAYMAEKVFHGLIDAYRLCGIKKAYPLCKALVDNFRSIPEIADAICRLGDNGTQDETYREIEWYTLSEAIFRFTDLAIEMGESQEYISQMEAFGKKFTYEEFWNIFLTGDNIFDYAPKAGVNTEFFHAYSHVNSFNSAAYLYRRTGESRYLEAAKNFHDFMLKTQVVATGGYGTIREWLLPKNRIIDALLHCHCTFENQCNTYATLRQNRFLTTATGDMSYGSTSELLYYNSFLASLETDAQGHAYYYSDYCADGGKKWLNPISWTCCSGTRPLAAMELLQNIYFRGDDGLYVNLLIASQVQCAYGSVSIEGDYTENGVITVRYSPDRAGEQWVHIRKPRYLQVQPEISGKEWSSDESLIHICFSGQKEQKICLRFTLPVYSQDIIEKGQGVRAYLYGPLVLAAEGIFKRPAPAASEFQQMKNGKYRAGEDTFKPFRDYEENEEYRMYFALEETI